MSEPDPFASPFHQVNLPGQPSTPMPAGFAGYPLPMPEADSRALAPSRPAALTAAFWCWIVGTVLVVVVLPAVFTTGGGALADELHANSQTDPEPMSHAEAEFAAQLTPVLFAFGFAVPAVLFVVAAVKLRSGRNWARVLLAVLGGLAVVFGLLALVGFASGEVRYADWLIGTVWALVFLASVMLGTVAMFLPPSNAYVRSVSRR
ncbi:hypothetical protein ACQPZF_39780 [Actinosynnema sp. CS-041913]|uniref:hypothetical protein n=1 Tax=Actinosynnema sp. CS-041913 TaxID=3239917 RepID=UPI003D8C2CE3